MKNLLIGFLSVFMLLTAFNSIAGEDWELSRDKEGIQVYTRKYKDYSYKEYKGITIMNGKVSDVIKILKDVATYENWSYKCVPGSAKLLKKDDSKGIYHVYMEIKAPLVANRDVIAVYKFNPPAADGSVMVEFWGDGDYIPEVNGKVRVPEMKGYWNIIPQANGKIKVVHQAFTHPGGSPPASLVNSSTIEAPFSMLKLVRDLIE
jgi:hypothetical protein